MELPLKLHTKLCSGDLCVYQFHLTDFMNIGEYDLLTCCASTLYLLEAQKNFAFFFVFFLVPHILKITFSFQDWYIFHGFRDSPCAMKKCRHLPLLARMLGFQNFWTILTLIHIFFVTFCFTFWIRKCILKPQNVCNCWKFLKKKKKKEFWCLPLWLLLRCWLKQAGISLT